MSSVRVDFHLAAPRGERVYNIYMGVEWKENIIHEGPKERTFFQPLLDVWGACACLRWESEKDFIDLSGIKKSGNTGGSAQRALHKSRISLTALGVLLLGAREEEEALRSHLPLIVVRRN
jgi:hypothetical protein